MADSKKDAYLKSLPPAKHGVFSMLNANSDYNKARPRKPTSPDFDAKGTAEAGKPNITMQASRQILKDAEGKRAMAKKIGSGS